MSAIAETYWQGGIESTRGTPVAATRKLYARAPIPKEERPKEYVNQARQSYVSSYDVVETHRHVPDIVFDFPAFSFDDAPWWYLLAAKGGVTPTGAGPYTWTFDGMATSDDLDSASLEVADGVGAFRIPFAMCKSWELSGKLGSGPSPLGAKFNLMGQKLEHGHTMTPALSDRDLVGSYMAMKNSQIYIDTAAGSIGSGEIAASLEEISIKADNKLQARFTGSASGGDYSYVNREERFVEFSAILRMNATTYGYFNSVFQANALRYLQFKNTGAGNDLLTFNIATKLETFEFPEDGPTRRVAIMGRSLYDATLGYDWRLTVQNDIASV